MSKEKENQLLSALVHLHELALVHAENNIIQEGLEIAVSLTESEIGYFHMVNEDQETVEIITWSNNTYQYCEAVYERHYPLSQAGVWADTARLKKAVIHNDYQNLPEKKGYPEGHAHLVRHLGVPVLDDGKVMILAGVGNKKSPYNDSDVNVMKEVLQKTWELIKYRRMIEKMRTNEVRLLEAQQIALISAWSYDTELNSFSFDDMIIPILGIPAEGKKPENLQELLKFIVPDQRSKLSNIIKSPEENPNFVLSLKGKNEKGDPCVLLIRASAHHRKYGRGIIYSGIIQDLTERIKQEEIHSKAYRDPLTGLGNRNMLIDHFITYQNRARRSPNDYFAIHFIDLDKFKPINDQYGHKIGDQILKIIGKRIDDATRKNDLAIRLGGDEFIVVQNSISNEKDASILAEKILRVVNEPVEVDGSKIIIGASIGIVINEESHFTLEDLLDKADKALYASKEKKEAKYSFFPLKP